MARSTGSADLPLHGGHVPPWLATRMTQLGTVITEAIVHHYGREEFLSRLSHPFWFQSFGAVMGMDWHSSGITTSVVGALKRGLNPRAHELGLFVCGGRGRHSRATPDELLQIGERTGLDGASLARSSRLVAKVDSAAIHDGFELYLHGFIVSAEGEWCVIQQGMRGETRTARRYHWLSLELPSFVEDPHRAIEGPNRGVIVNLADSRAQESRRAQVALVQNGPDRVLRTLGEHTRFAVSESLSLFERPSLSERDDLGPSTPHLEMPAHHEVVRSDIQLRKLRATLAAAAERGPIDFPELLLQPGIGARCVASLAFVAEVIHGAPSRFRDPARFSMAHGGKDGHPFPVPLRVYDETIQVLKRAIQGAQLGREDKLEAIRRLDVQARTVEGHAAGPTFDEYVAKEQQDSSDYGGRTVFGLARPPTELPAKTKRKTHHPSAQLKLPGLRRAKPKAAPARKPHR